MLKLGSIGLIAMVPPGERSLKGTLPYGQVRGIMETIEIEVPNRVVRWARLCGPGLPGEEKTA